MHDAPAHTAKGDVPIRVTIGVAETLGGPDDVRAAVLERTDAALYVAKEAGRNRVASSEGVVARDAAAPA